MTISDLYTKSKDSLGQTVTVRGWIRNHRKQKNIGFIELYDGSYFKSL